jgi:hypothetical protein
VHHCALHSQAVMMACSPLPSNARVPAIRVKMCTRSCTGHRALAGVALNGQTVNAVVWCVLNLHCMGSRMLYPRCFYSTPFERGMRIAIGCDVDIAWVLGVLSDFEVSVRVNFEGEVGQESGCE